MRTLTICFLGATLAGAAALPAQDPPTGPERPMRQRMQPPQRPDLPPGAGLGALGFAPARLVDRREALNLTPDQVSRLETLAQEVRQAGEKAAADAKGHEERLRELWKAEEPDPRAIETSARALMQARQVEYLTALTAAARAKAVLTPEQRGRVLGWADGQRFMARQRLDRPGRGPRPGLGLRRGGPPRIR